jgi:hypothetical protein
MSATEKIIIEIDACLDRLRQARTLLTTSDREPMVSGHLPKKQKKRQGAKRRVRRKSSVRETAAGSKTLAEKDTPTISVPASQFSLPPATAAPLVPAETELAAKMVEAGRVSPALAEGVTIKRYRSSYRGSPRHGARHRSLKPAPQLPDESSKPAIALAGPPSVKVVVVSAEQARRERERIVPAEARPVRIPTLGGKTAFEALFKN